MIKAIFFILCYPDISVNMNQKIRFTEISFTSSPVFSHHLLSLHLLQKL